jgi:VanZ family protein
MWLRIEDVPRWLRDGLPLVLWMGLIFAFSSQPALINLESDTDEKMLYKTAHFIVYAVLAWLWWRFLAPQRQLNWSVLLLAFVLTTLYGITDEIHQLFVPSRHGQPADVLFDAAGALAMILLIRRIAWLRTMPEALNLPLIRLSGGQS